MTTVVQQGADAERREAEAGPGAKVRVWDWPTRLFHWLLVTCFLSAWVSFEYAAELDDPTLKWHRWNGYAILVLLVFRFLWGFAGSSTARFGALPLAPASVLRYLRATATGRQRPFLGHNPLGSWMVLALLLGLLIQAGLGLFTLEHNEITAGPLQRLISFEATEVISEWHRAGFNLLLALVCLHILANSLYQIVKRDPLVTAMLTGRKPARDYADALSARVPPKLALRAGLCLAAALLVVFGGITVAGGRLL